MSNKWETAICMKDTLWVWCRAPLVWLYICFFKSATNISQPLNPIRYFVAWNSTTVYSNGLAACAAELGIECIKCISWVDRLEHIEFSGCIRSVEYIDSVPLLKFSNSTKNMLRSWSLNRSLYCKYNSEQSLDEHTSYVVTICLACCRKHFVGNIA